jgi:uncharacterized protein YkwD
MEPVTTRRAAALMNCVLAGLLLFSCALPLPVRTGDPAYVPPLTEGSRNVALTDMEKEVVRLTNDLRTNPKKWASELRAQKGGGDQAEEASLFLNDRAALKPLKVSKGLCLAARQLLTDHGPRGLTGHKGSDGSTSFIRMNNYGLWDGKAAENLYYGYSDADSLMTAAVTEGGSQGWEQRKNLLNPDFTAIGIACGPHNVYRTMCVIDFAEVYAEAP